MQRFDTEKEARENYEEKKEATQTSALVNKNTFEDAGNEYSRGRDRNEGGNYFLDVVRLKGNRILTVYGNTPQTVNKFVAQLKEMEKNNK